MRVACVLAAVAVAATVAFAQTNVPGVMLMPPEGGSSNAASAVTVTAVLLDSMTYSNVNQTDAKGHYWPLYPYFRTVGDLVAAQAAGSTFWLVQQLENNVLFMPIYNFSAAESATIATWLQTQPAGATNVEVSFSATWSNYRIVIDTTAWTRSGMNLVPYDVLPTCNLQVGLYCMKTLQESLPVQCDPYGVGMLKGCFTLAPGCLGPMIRSIGLVATLCQTQISIVQGSVCNDSVAGANALCGYIANMMPSGVASADGSVVVSAGTGGTPPAGSVGATPKKSGAAAVGVAAALAAAVATLLF